MQKKFIKRGSDTRKVSKTFSVTDVEGNKHVLKATIVGVNKTAVEKSGSSGLDDDLETLGLEGRVIEPPLPPQELSRLWEYSSELGQTVDAMEIGIEGFGGRLVPRKMSDEQRQRFADEIQEEHEFLANLLDFPNPRDSFVSLRRKSRKDRETTGNSYWELVPMPTNPKRYSCINLIKSEGVRIIRADRTLGSMKLNFIKSDLSVGQKIFPIRFRRFVQIVGTKKVFFKEFGDDRIIDRRNGEVADESLPEKFRAHELCHSPIWTPRNSPYGMPRFAGNIISIRGSRQSDEANLVTLMNNNIPSFAVLANGGMLTQGSVDRIREFVENQMKGSLNYSKWLLLEGEASHDGLSSPSSVKIDIVPLTREQHSDQLWQSYDENNAKKIRRSSRQAPILIGASENYDRATAQVSERLTEKYVYNPEREEEDRQINKILLRQGIRFWTYKSNSPNVTNDEDLVKILTGAERTGGLTPRIARTLLEDILNRDLPGFDDLPPDFDPDIPFSLTLARIQRGAGMANQNGTLASQGQTPQTGESNGVDGPFATSDPQEAIEQMLDQPHRYLEALTKIRDSLEDKLDDEGFGEVKDEYFKSTSTH